jgi:hypothetical protein
MASLFFIIVTEMKEANFSIWRLTNPSHQNKVSGYWSFSSSQAANAEFE